MEAADKQEEDKVGQEEDKVDQGAGEGELPPAEEAPGGEEVPVAPGSELSMIRLKDLMT